MKNERQTGEALPSHIGIIMDGNGRWASSRLLPRSAGHKAGMERMIGLLEHAFDRGIKTVTVYALSTENLSRPKEELDALFSMFRTYFERYAKKIIDRKSRLRVIGDVSALPKDVRELIWKKEEESKDFTAHTVNIAMNYGSRDEIVRAVNLAVERGEKVDKESFSRLLYTAGQDDPDLIIRTGKELRLSNFLLYQAAYAELYFSDKMFPAFTDEDLDGAIREYALRSRRFGKV